MMRNIPTIIKRMFATICNPFQYGLHFFDDHQNIINKNLNNDRWNGQPSPFHSPRRIIPYPGVPDFLPYFIWIQEQGLHIDSE